MKAPEKLIILIILINSKLVAFNIDNGYSIQLFSGVSFSKSIKNFDHYLRNGNVSITYPAFSYLASINKLKIEVGIKFAKVGNRIEYLDNPYKISSSTIIRNSLVSCPINLFYPLNPKNKLFLFSGLTVAYNFQNSTLITSDSFAIIKSDHIKGIKFNANVGFRQFFKIKSKAISFEISYSKGFSKFYKIYTINLFSLSQNEYVNRGSNISVGLSYYFGKRKRSDNINLKI